MQGVLAAILGTMSDAHRPLQPWQVIAGGLSGLVLTLGLARFAYTPLLPVMQAQTGLSDAAAGALAAVNYAGYMSGALAVAWLDDVRWRHRFYSAGLWMALLVTAAMALSAWWPAWALWRFIGGLCGATGMLLGSGLVLGWLMQHGRRPELGLHFMGIGLGIVFSAVGAWGLGLWLDDWASRWWAFALLGLVFFVPAWRWRPPVPPQTHPTAHQAASSTVSPRWQWTLMASYFTAGWGFVISATFTVAIVEREPALAGQGPWAWALVGVTALPAVFLWDRIARRIGDIRALMLAMALQTLSVALPAVSGALGAMLAGAALYGATFIGIVSLTLALVGRRSPANPGKAMARLTLSYGAAQVLAPALTGAMAQVSGSFRGGLWLTAAMLVLGLALLASLPKEK
jgi:MFS family permease